MTYGMLSSNKKKAYVDLVTATDDMKNFQVHYYDPTKQAYQSSMLNTVDPDNDNARIASITVAKEANSSLNLMLTVYKNGRTGDTYMRYFKSSKAQSGSFKVDKTHSLHDLRLKGNT